MAVIPTVLGRVANGSSIRPAAHDGSVRGAGRRRPAKASSPAPVEASGPDKEHCAELARNGSLANGSLKGAADHELLSLSIASANDRALADRAFAELYSRHKTDIYTYCVRMMGRDEDQGQDLFQEVFIRAYESAGQFRSKANADGAQGNVRGWLYTIARNLCLNALRGRRPVESIDLHPGLPSQDRSLAPEFDESQHFLREQIESAVAALPVEFREAFVLREFDGFSYAQIAQMTGTSLSVTKVRIWRAKERLRTLLKPYLAE